MKRNRLREKDIKKRRTIFIVSMFAATFLLASGYAAFNTVLNINAKGNLINVPKISPSDMIAPENIKDPTSTDDGLYADPEEENRYIFKGADPDNYITIGDEEYRIMSIESDGTLKVIKNDKIDSVWDPGYSTSIAGVTEANSVTGTRYSNVSTDFCYQSSGNESDYYGCKSWGSSTTTLDSNGNNVTKMPRFAGNATTYDLPTTEAYVNTYLNTTYLNALLAKIDVNKRAYIEEHNFNIGPVANTVNQTLATEMSQEAAYKWKGKVGLMTSTEYVKASTNSACTSVREYYNTSVCYNNSTTHNFLAKSYNQWTMSPYSNSGSTLVWRVISAGTLTSNFGATNYSGVRPVLYLSSDVKLKGKGTSSNKYEIA